jgi:hypothetical protein
MKTLITNFYGGPSTGKSSMMFGVAGKLKWRGIDCDIAPEYAKFETWKNQRNRKRVMHPDGGPFMGELDNQIKIFGEQHHMLHTLCGNVDVVITDSPLLMQLVYSTDNELNNLIINEHQNFNTLDIFLVRKKPFNPNGRFQTEEQAIELDKRIKSLLKEFSNNDYLEIDGLEENEMVIAEIIMERLKLEKLNN